jgi:hypothetical protein
LKLLSAVSATVAAAAESPKGSFVALVYIVVRHVARLSISPNDMGVGGFKV